MSAPKFGLDNLNVILDKNNFQQTGSEEITFNNLQKNGKVLDGMYQLDGHNLRN